MIWDTLRQNLGRIVSPGQVAAHNQRRGDLAFECLRRRPGDVLTFGRDADIAPPAYPFGTRGLGVVLGGGVPLDVERHVRSTSGGAKSKSRSTSCRRYRPVAAFASTRLPSVASR